MKLSLPLKLGIFVVLLFAAVIAACLLWTPVKIRYYSGRLKTNDIDSYIKAVDTLRDYGVNGEKEFLRKYPDGERAAAEILKAWDDVNANISPVDIVRKHINPAANPSLHALHGYTVLHLAAGKNWVFSVKLLLAKGAEPNREAIIGSKNGFFQPGNIGSALHLAAAEGNLEIIKLLVEKRGNLNTYYGMSKAPPRDKPVIDFTVLECAKDEKTRKFLISLGAKTTSEIGKDFRK